MMATGLSIRGATVRLGGRPVLSDVSLDVPPGKVVGLVGPNGAGKSSLMRATSGLLEMASGAAFIDGRDIRDLRPSDRARKLAFLPQDRTIAWPVDVATLVRLGRLPWRDAPHDLSGETAVQDAMRALDVERLAGRRTTELSGGEQARVLTARAMAQDTPVLVADEPASGLDPAQQIGLMAALRAYAARGRAVLVSLHDLGLAARWCDRVALLDNGRLVAEGLPADVLDADRLRDVFGIVAHIGSDECGPVISPIGLSRPLRSD